MNFGYLIIIAENSEYDYTKMAYALAMSIKNTQKQGYDKVTLVTDNVDKIKKLESSWVFDYVIEWKQETFWDGRSWMDQLSPFEHTVCLDADMLFTRDYSHWVDYFIDNCDLYVANKSYTYRGELVSSDFYRRTFTENQLPNLYSFYTYFRKDAKLCDDFFTLGRFIIKNPTEFSNMFLQEYKPKIVGTDEAFALSAKILGIEDEISYSLEFPRVVHMKPMVQNWPYPSDVWSDNVALYVNQQGNVKISSFMQSDIVHYVEKDKITDEVISLLEGVLWKKT